MNTKKSPPPNREKKTYYSVSDEVETIYFQDVGMAEDYLQELREDGRAVKYSRVKKVKMTEEEFNNLHEI